MSTPSHFIHFLADKIAEQERHLWKDTLVILPSRRAALHLRNALFERADGAFVHPLIHTSESWMRDLTRSRNLEPAKELALLYQMYRKTHQPHPESFDAFLKWAPTFISDLNEADRYLCPLDELYRFTFDIKRLESWNVSNDPEEQTNMVSSYLKFWKNLNDTRKEFHSHCLELGEYPQGLSYRVAAENFEDLWPKWKNTNGINRVLVSGINAMNKAEEHIFSLLAEDSVEFIYDLPEILKERQQEAGQFIRNYLDWKSTNHCVSEPEIQGQRHWVINSSPGHQEQFQIAGNIIKDLVRKEGKEVLEKTALVLADEQWLLPALNALPEEVDKVNITMGLPLQDHPMTQLIIRTIKLIGEWKEDNVNTQLVKDIFNAVSQLSHSKEIQSYSFPTKSRMDEKDWNQLWEALQIEGLDFQHERDPLNAAITLSNWLIAALPSGMNKLCLQEILERLLQVRELILNTGDGEGSSVKSIEQVFRILMKDARVDFQGEPLEGLQVMGILESRSLEFDHLIFTSLNEGILPKGRPVNSLFPFEVRRTFKLPDHGEKDSIYGYHFLRLLSRSQQAWLIFSEGSDGISTAERSRFLLQLEYEWQKFYGSKLQISSTTSVVKPGVEHTEDKIAKSPEVLKQLQEMSKKGFSPSALTLFMSDPIKFFLRYLSGIKDNSSSKILDARGFGNVFHKVMELFYKPFVGASLYAEVIKERKNEIKSLILEACEEQGVDVDDLSGQHALGFDMLEGLIEKNIDQDLKQLENDEIELLALERRLELELDNGMKIRGIADRIDKVNGVVRIIDYKTGGVTRSSLKARTIDVVEDGKHKEAFQLLCYSLMASKAFQSDSIKASIYMTQAWSKGPAELTVNGEKEFGNDILGQFEVILKQVIQDLLNPELDFATIPEIEEDELYASK